MFELNDNFKALLSGGLPELLDLGTGNTDTQQFNERIPPIDPQDQATNSQVSNDKTMLLIGGAALLVVVAVVALKK